MPLRTVGAAPILRCNKHGIDTPEGTENARTPNDGVPMLSLFIANTPAPAEEPIDRDPGVITLAAALIRAVRRQHDAAFRRRCEQATTTTAI
jgi:hypothetical protein